MQYNNTTYAVYTVLWVFYFYFFESEYTFNRETICQCLVLTSRERVPPQTAVLWPRKADIFTIWALQLSQRELDLWLKKSKVFWVIFKCEVMKQLQISQVSRPTFAPVAPSWGEQKTEECKNPSNERMWRTCCLCL